MIRKTPEDLYHRLPQAQPRLSPSQAPFVGNATIDDNIAEAVQVALWNALPDARGSVHARVKNGHVTLTGTVHVEAEKFAAEAAVQGLHQVVEVINEIRMTQAALSAPGSPVLQVQRERMLYVTRYCGLEPASVIAAIKQASAALDAIVDTSQQVPADLIVIYRNARSETITLDIGCPVDAIVTRRAAGEVMAGWTPSGPTATVELRSDLPGILAALDAIKAQAESGSDQPIPVLWQRVSREHLVPHAVSAALPLYRPLPSGRR